MEEPFLRTVKRSLAAFDDLVPAVDAWLARRDVAGRPLHVTHLVLEEVLRNLVEHARCDGRDDVVVELRVAPPVLTIVVEDECAPYDPREAPPLDVDAPLEARRAGGMGLHLLQAMTRALRYERAAGRNRLEVDVALTDDAAP